jgi:hypothetical protein
MSQHRGILSSPSSLQSLQSSKKRYVFLQRRKSRIRYLPSLYPFIPTYIYHHHHLPLSPYTHSTHILRTTHMHILIWLYGRTHSSGSMVWLCNKCLQVCISCLPTYKLHISLLVIGWERRHNVTLSYTKNTTYSEREGIHHQCLGKDPQIPQMRDLRGSYKGISEFYLKIYKTLE